MSILRDVATNLNLKPKLVKTVYDGVVDAALAELKAHRKTRLPRLAILGIKFRPAKPKRKGRNPFTGLDQIFKAKAASNKARFRPVKELKVFVDKLPKVAPKKKHKKPVKKTKKH
jgi:nucleoid DNA-binding protein